MSKMYANYPLTDITDGQKLFVLSTLGYTVYKMIDHLFLAARRNDFIEMLLHHVITISLYYSAYMMNYLPVEMMTIFCLDIADWFIAVARAVSDTEFKKTQYVAGFLMFTSWVYTRDICFSQIIYYGFKYSCSHVPTWNGTESTDEWFILQLIGAFCIFL